MLPDVKDQSNRCSELPSTGPSLLPSEPGPSRPLTVTNSVHQGVAITGPSTSGAQTSATMIHHSADECVNVLHTREPTIYLLVAFAGHRPPCNGRLQT